MKNADCSFECEVEFELIEFKWAVAGGLIQIRVEFEL